MTPAAAAYALEAEPHCSRCGVEASEGTSGIGQTQDGGYVLLVCCDRCGDEQPISGEDTYCLVCGEPTSGAGKLEGVLFRGRPLELLACLPCYDRVRREDPALAWVDGLAMTVAASAS